MAVVTSSARARDRGYPSLVRRLISAPESLWCARLSAIECTEADLAKSLENMAQML